MELPNSLKSLYKHWELHTVKPNMGRLDIEFENQTLLLQIASFVHERMQVWERKTINQAPPYTADPILQKYRFCNIFRELDRQTIEFHTLLKPLENNFSLWLLNMFYCRMIARPQTVRAVGLLSYNKEQNEKVFKKLITLPRPRFGTPYVFPISTLLRSPTPTREEFLCRYLPSKMQEIVAIISTWEKKDVYRGVIEITKAFGFNHSFLWTEVLIDVAYQFPQYINLYGRFPIGPGALPTFKRINQKQDPSLLAKQLCSYPLDTKLTFNNKPIYLSAENWEGIGCEFRKYTNLQQGKGRKRIYATL